MLVDAARQQVVHQPLLDGPQLGDQRLGTVDQVVDGGEDAGDFALFVEIWLIQFDTVEVIPAYAGNARGLIQGAELVLLGWLGLRVKPKPFPAFAGGSPLFETVPLPDGLPAPVERCFRQAYGGDRVPLIESAVISGRAVMSPVGGVKIPARFRFYHRAGHDYRHLFEMTWFGRTFGTGNEHYLNGKSRLVLPFGLSDEGPQIDQAANLSLWAEYVTNRRTGAR